MKREKIQLLLTGVAACVSLLLMITTTYGASIVIGGDYADIGTIVIISPKPGDTPQANGAAILSNLAGISADASTPYVIRLGPGIYDIGTNGLQMKPHVDVEGSGETTTIIRGNLDSGTLGVVRGANNGEIRFLTVQNTGGGTSTVAVSNDSVDKSFKMTHMTATASGGEGWNAAVSNTNASPTMTDVTASAIGMGAGPINLGILNTSSSPTMTNVTASASGVAGSLNQGVQNYLNSTPTMMNVIASASGGLNSYGVYNYNSAAPTMTNVTASALGATNNYGVYNTSASPTMINVTASASGGTTNVGVLSNGTTSTIRINHSVIIGSTNTVSNSSPVVTYIGNTQLDGGAVSGTLTCVGVYSGTFVGLGATCQ